MKTLIIPTVSISHLPQHVVNLFIASFPNHTPIPLDPTYLYAYVSSKASLITTINMHPIQPTIQALQLHSPVLPGYESLFAEQIKEVVIKEGIDHVIVIDSKDRGFLGDDQARLVYWTTNSNDEDLADLFTHLQIESNTATENTLSKLNSSIRTEDTCSLVQFLSSGLNGIRIDYYGLYLYPGDNWADVADMATVVAGRLGLELNNSEVTQLRERDIKLANAMDDTWVEGIYS
ncbi:hypothetical protein DAMA08_025280 [Martiniozyma asiatica (nom. inval.)]|nr:hypothetical protein DAMA08_025280 [Martiniozyma asiatica]